MALTEEDIKKHKQLVDKVNELSALKQDIISTGKAKRQQALEILQSYGYDSLQDVSKLQEKLEELEQEIQKERTEIENEIIEINKLKEEVDNLIVS